MHYPLNKFSLESLGLGLVLFAGLAALSFYSNKKLDRLRQERDAKGVFVVGTAVEEENNLKGTLIVDFTYFFKGRQFSNSIATDKWLYGGLNVRQRRFYARVAVGNPENSELFLDYPVPDSVGHVPADGWDHMPGYSR